MLDAEGSTLTFIGDPALLLQRSLALICSVKCPGDIILQTYDLALALRKARVAVVGGFHSPMEKECLELLLRGSQPVLLCPARSLVGISVPSGWKQPIAEGRLLVLSPFEEKYTRPTKELGRARNRFVAALADRILVAYAEPGGITEQTVREALAWGKPVFALESAANKVLLDLGALPFRLDMFE